MSKPKAKILVRCPHCGFEQREPTLVRSTYCRQCSEYFAVNSSVIATGAPAAPVVPRGPRLVNPTPTPSPPPAPRPAAEATPATPPTAAIPGPPVTADVGGSAMPPPTPPGTVEALAPAPTPAPVNAVFPRPTSPAAAPDDDRLSLRERLGQWMGGPPKNQMVRCFECNGAQEVSGVAQSTICKDCGAYVDLQDYKINGNFSRNIVTRGSVLLNKGGDLSSSKVVCTAATLLGRMRGNLSCSGKVTIRFRGKMPGTLEAGYLVVEKGAELEFARPVRVSALDIHGTMHGQINCEGHVTVHKTGILIGAVRAKGFFVDKGGGFEGELTISPREMTASAELAATPAGVDHVPAGSPVETPPLEPRRVWAQSSALIDQDPLPN